MQELKVGDAAPEFTLPDENGNPVSLSDFRGRRVVLFFYPRDAKVALQHNIGLGGAVVVTMYRKGFS